MNSAYTRLLRALEPLEESFAKEILEVRTGRKDRQDMTSILKAQGDFLDKGSIQELRRGLDRETGGSRELGTRLYFTLVGLWLYRELAPRDDAFQTRLSHKTVTVAGEAISYYDLHSRIVREADFEKREVLGRALGSVHAEMGPEALGLLEAKHALLAEEWGYPDHRDYCAEKKQMDYGRFRDVLTASLERLRPLYRATAEEWTRRKLGKPFGDLSRWHASYILRLDHLDTLFPKTSMVERLTAALERLGLGLKAFPNIHLDLEERPAKNPRAFCLSVQIPQEVHLVLKPVGGITDHETFLHEAGHALHHGNTDPALAYPFRHLARSYALTETYAFLLQNLTMDPVWLEGLGLAPREAREVRRSRIFLELYMYLRYVAKFLFEHELYGTRDFANGRPYAERLTGTLGFRYEPSGHLFDLDSDLYSADYLRAWIAEAQLSRVLRSKFGGDWSLKKECGGFLQGLWKEGERPCLESLIAELGGTPFDPGPLEERFRELEG